MIPEHYSRDIAQRCQTLIRNLRPVVQRGLPGDSELHGALSRTFLLALATPMIVLPIERILKSGDPRTTPAADDSKIDPALSREVHQVLGPGRTFGSAPFAVAGRWSYIRGYPPFNVAQSWPPQLLQKLGMSQASSEADSAPARRLLLDLRNALAHGGIAYLDATGKQTDRDAAMLAFASTQRDNGRLGLNILRISEEDFCAFLIAWGNWLSCAAHPRSAQQNEPARGLSFITSIVR
jgi:hypothetical protein